MNELETTWQLNAARIIFQERYKAALPIQTNYRRYRTMRKITNSVLLQPYNNPLLSDIPLAPTRHAIKYFFSRSIRNIKRVIWFHCVKIQSLWRRFQKVKQLKKRFLRIFTAQSFIRMVPSRLTYLRMKKSIIKLQAWGRMQRYRKLFQIEKRSCLIIQTSLRRYFAILLRWRLLESIWGSMEREYSAVAVLLSAVRCYFARQKVKRLRRIIREREIAGKYFSIRFLQICFFFLIFL